MSNIKTLNRLLFIVVIFWAFFSRRRVNANNPENEWADKLKEAIPSFPSEHTFEMLP